jgi:hypothetical protein
VLEVRSTPGEGTTVRGRVPAEPQDATGREEDVDAFRVPLGAGEIA